VRDSPRLLAVAFGFLTRLPAPRVVLHEGDLARASALFPLVGLVVAALAVAADQLVTVVLGQIVGAVVGILTVTLVTGAFHEDGLADTADGLWGGWDPSERLRIMRDSRLGTYGTVALIAVFALRFALLVPVPPRTFAVAMVCGHVLGRLAGPALVMLLPPLTDSSSAAIAGRLGPVGRLVVATLAILPVVAAAGLWAVPTLVVAGVVVLACATVYRRRLGGVTGDAIGATTVLIELAVVAVIVASQR
jgi:adenosylcobinamide-GDP ribazoletransferase